MRRIIWAVLATVLGVYHATALGQEADRRPGEQPGQRITLPNQWFLDPAGDEVPLGDFPMNGRLSPDGRYFAVLHCGAGEHEIIVFDTQGMKALTRTQLKNAYYGLAFAPDGGTLYVSGGETEAVLAYPFADGFLAAPRSLTIAPEKEQHVPCGLSVRPDGAMLAVALTWGNAVVLLDTASGEVAARKDYPAESRPYDVVFSPDGGTLYVSLWGAAGVDVVNAADMSAARIETGDHPNEMALSSDGARLFVANANVNTISIIDTAEKRVVETLNTAMYPDSLEGSTPNSVALSPDETKLYIANADNNTVAVYDITEPGRTRALGLIPTGWYPTSVRVSGDGKTLYVANGKGFGSVANPQGPNPYWRGERKSFEQHIKLMLPGTMSVIPVPDEAQLEAYTARAYACSPYQSDKLPPVVWPEGNPVPAKVGDPSPIKHCIYIVKENRTYDQVLGDMPEGSGAPELCLFPEPFTPNHHALAREFVLLDNFYVESQVSADGHEWSMGAYATDFVQKTWPSNYGGHGLRFPAEGRIPTAFPTAGYIWDRCAEAGVTYRSYGEFVENAAVVGEPAYTEVETLKGHFDPYFRGFDMNYLDVKRAERFLEEFHAFVAEGTLPQFMVVRLPNDHTSGTKEGSFTPRAMVADNDLGLGMIVDAISKSPVWKETALFVVEDDAQNGPDHIDAHRTVAFVISPYTRGRGKDSTMYSTASMLRTMELILGLQPMSQYDAGARPMYNTFKNDPDLTPYECRPVPEEIRTRVNSPDAWGVELSAKLDLEKEDRADDILFNEIIWRAVRGGDSPMPAPVRAAFLRVEDEGEEEE